MQQENHPTPEQAREASEIDPRPAAATRARATWARAAAAGATARPDATGAGEGASRASSTEGTGTPSRGEKSVAKEQAGQTDKAGERWHERPATKIEEKIFHVMDAATRGGPPVAASLSCRGNYACPRGRGRKAKCG